MNIIKSIIADCEALLKRIETEIGGTHPTIGIAASGIKAAATSIAQHPDASAAPSTIVSPGMDAPAPEANAPAPAAAPANAAPIAPEPAAPPIAPGTPA